MSDTIDDANERAEQFLNEALRKQQENRHINKESNMCVECGIELVEFRREYGTCVECQEELEELERLKKMRGKI